MLLLLLVAADLLFVAAHLVHVYTPYLPGPLSSLERDRGHAEHFQYVKLLWLVMLFAGLALRQRSLVHGAWATVFAYLLVDDALSIHETYGAAVADALGLGAPAGLGPSDLGQVVVSGAAGAVLLLLVGLTCRAAGDREREQSRVVLAMVAALAFFGVVVDMAGSALRQTPLARPAGLLEDAGELLVVSLILATVFRWAEPARGQEVPSTKTTWLRVARMRSSRAGRYSGESYQERACPALGNSSTTRR